jgi:hypothetical protein
MELQLQMEVIERKHVWTALFETFVILQFASSPFESCGGIGAYIFRFIYPYDEAYTATIVQLRLELT